MSNRTYTTLCISLLFTAWALVAIVRTRLFLERLEQPKWWQMIFPSSWSARGLLASEYTPEGKRLLRTFWIAVLLAFAASGVVIVTTCNT